MSALPVDAKIAPHTGMNLEFVRRVLGDREAKRLRGLFDEAEAAARQRIDEAASAAEEIFAHARSEALETLKALPDFAALQSRPYGAEVMRAIRRAADHYGLSMAAVTGRAHDPLAAKARHDAVVEIIKARPTLSDASIAHLFCGLSIAGVRKIRRGGNP